MPFWFLTVIEFESDKRDEVLERWEKYQEALNEGKIKRPQGMKVTELSDIAGGRMFRLVKFPDDMDWTKWNPWDGPYGWNDLGKVEVIRVADTQRLMNLLKKGKWYDPPWPPPSPSS